MLTGGCAMNYGKSFLRTLHGVKKERREKVLTTPPFFYVLLLMNSPALEIIPSALNLQFLGMVTLC